MCRYRVPGRRLNYVVILTYKLVFYYKAKCRLFYICIFCYSKSWHLHKKNVSMSLHKDLYKNVWNSFIQSNLR